MGPLLIPSTESAGPHPWEIGWLGYTWDAWVAIGTLALAAVTVGAILIPLLSARCDRIEKEKKAKVDARTFATALQDENNRLMMTLAAARNHLRTNGGPTAVNWKAVYHFLQMLSTPVLDGSFSHIFLLDDDTARWVLRTRGNVVNLREYIRQFDGREAEFADIAFEAVLPMVLQLQRFATTAAGNLSHVAEASEVEVMAHVPLTASEEAVVKWFEAGADNGKRPAWPSKA